MPYAIPYTNQKSTFHELHGNLIANPIPQGIRGMKVHLPRIPGNLIASQFPMGLVEYTYTFQKFYGVLAFLWRGSP
jgi:hypothetical protein